MNSNWSGNGWIAPDDKEQRMIDTSAMSERTVDEVESLIAEAQRVDLRTFEITNRILDALAK